MTFVPAFSQHRTTRTPLGALARSGHPNHSLVPVNPTSTTHDEDKHHGGIRAKGDKGKEIVMHARSIRLRCSALEKSQGERKQEEKQPLKK